MVLKMRRSQDYARLCLQGKGIFQNSEINRKILKEGL
jgi:hypothetical protein